MLSSFGWSSHDFGRFADLGSAGPRLRLGSRPGLAVLAERVLGASPPKSREVRLRWPALDCAGGELGESDRHAGKYAWSPPPHQSMPHEQPLAAHASLNRSAACMGFPPAQPPLPLAPPSAGHAVRQGGALAEL